MSLEYPENRTEISDKMQVDVKNQLPSSDPFLRANLIFTLLIAYSDVVFDLYTTIQNLQNELFPDTATGIFADRWAGFKGITNNAASQAEGPISLTGTATTVVVANTLLQTSAGDQYETVSDTTISAQSITVTLARNGSTVTATALTTHHLATALSVTISGANETDYNGTYTIVVTSLTEFTYTITTTPTTPATGTILAGITFASVETKSIDFGSDTNLDGGTPLTFVVPLAGVDSTAYAQYEGIKGGTDEEDNIDFVERYSEAYRDPIAQFNEAQVIATAKEVAGVTRVFVDQATPQAGQVTVYFMRDNDTNTIPTSAEVLEVEEKLLAIKPVEMEDVDVIVSAPTPVDTPFTFISLSPNTTTMQNSITESLELFFKENTEVGVNIAEDAYRSAIYQTIDIDTGQRVESFSLSAPPSGDVAIAAGEIGILGAVQF